MKWLKRLFGIKEPSYVQYAPERTSNLARENRKASHSRHAVSSVSATRPTLGLSDTFTNSILDNVSSGEHDSGGSYDCSSDSGGGDCGGGGGFD